MAHSKTVLKIVEVCKVAPPPEASDLDSTLSPKSLPLTFFDLLWLRFPPIQRLFFYEFPTPNNTYPNTTAYYYSNILPRLKHSLSHTLKHFLPLAGNLTWPESSYKPVFVYVEGEDAVSLTVAESDADFYRLSGTNEFLEAVEYHPLTPNLAVSHERAAILAVQITLFPNCGFSIGLTMHHAALDGKSVHLFVKSWTHMCRSGGEYSLDLKPCHDRSVVKDPVGLDAIYAKKLQDLDDGPGNRSLMPWKFIVPSDSVRGTFKLTRANIQKLRQLVEVDQMVKRNKQLNLSTFCITCAYIVICLTKAEEISEDENDNKIELVFAADARSRLESPVPETYFGNCLGGRFVVADAKELVGKDGLAVATKAIAEALKSLEIKESLLKGAENWVSVFIERTSLRCSEPEGKDVFKGKYSIAGSPRFEAYNSDFAWGRPKKTDVVSIDRTRGISLSDTRNGDGVEVGLVLKKHYMQAFASLFTQGLLYSESN